MFAIGKRGLAAMGAMVLAGAWMGGGLEGARASAQLPAYFNPGDAAPYQPMIFMRQTPPPPDDQDNRTSYAYGPITDSAALNVTAQNRSTWTGGHNWVFVWANRAQVPPGDPAIQSNPIYPAILNGRGVPYLTEFTTVARADAATKAEILYDMGAPPSVWQAPLAAAGVNAIYWSTLAADPDAYFTTVSQDGKFMVTVDKMVIPTAVATRNYGIVVDYEVQDHRTPSETHPFLDDLGATIRSYGLKAYLYTNPWDSTSPTQLSGFSFDRMADIKANFDYISLYVWGGQGQCNLPASYPQSVAFLKGADGKLNFSQIIVTIDLFYCTSIDASAIGDQRNIDHLDRKSVV